MKSFHWVNLEKFVFLGLLASCAHGPASSGSGSGAAGKVVASSDKEAVLVLFLSDLHSHLKGDTDGRGGYAQVKKWIDFERAKAGPKTDVVVIGGGDLIGKGSIPCQETNDKECGAFFKDFGLAYSTLGNYELYNSPTDMAAFVKATGAQFIGMNVSPKKGTASWSNAPLKFKGQKSGLEFWLASWTSPFDIKDYNVRAFPAASDWMAWKRQWNAPVLFLTHQELERDLGFLKDACLSLSPQTQVLALLKSNDHRTMQQDSSQCAPMLEPGAFGRYGLKLLITRDAQNPARLQTASEFVEIKGFGEDAGVKARVDALYARYAPDAGQVLFSVDQEISRESLASWMAEGYHKRMKAEAAITNIGFVKNSLPVGPVTREDFFLALPYKNELYGLDWSVKDMEQALCAAALRKRVGDLDWGSELSFSGFSLENAGTPQCHVVAPKKSLKVVVDEYLLSRSERWLGRDLKSRSFKFGVDSRRVATQQLQVSKPVGAH
ncbi:MAG: 5'-nucleotidase C-terminal domain-containing protein [Bdellovibrionota bacterium]